MLKVMIVDDEPNIRKGLIKVINWKEHGFEVLAHAEDGLEALEVYKKERPDAVITDIKMPGMDGLQLSYELKKIDRNISIILLSGYSDFAYAKQAIQNGVDGYLLKPVNQKELILELEKIKDKTCSQFNATKREYKQNEKLKDYFLFRLVTGNEQHEYANQLLMECNLKLQSKNYCTTILCIDQYGNMMDSSAEGVIFEKIGISRLIEEILYDSQNGHLFEITENQFGVLFFDNENAQMDKNSLILMAEKIIQAFSKRRDISVTIGIGKIVDTLDKINESYRKAVKSLDRKYTNHIDKIFYYDDIREQKDDFENILSYIHEKYRDEISLKILSDLFYINSVYLGQLFKKKTGEYFHDYLNKIRLEKALYLIKETNLSMNDIANQVGYKHIEHFYRTFKEFHRCNPGGFRRNDLQK